MRMPRESSNTIKPISRFRRTAMTGLFVALVAALGVGTGIVRAQLSNTFSTTTTVPPGATMSTVVSTPGVTITGSTPISGCPTTGLGTASVTYTCAASSGGISVGTPIIQTFAGAGGAVAETVTYNANGPVTGAAAVATATTATGNCTTPASVGATVTCGTQTTAETVPTGTLNVTVTGAGGQSVQITAAPSTLGSCPLTSSLPSATAAAPTPVVITYTCGGGESVPTGTNTSLTVQTTIAIGQPTTTAIANANAPIPATAAIPSPTTQSLSAGATGPTIASILPNSGGQGTVVTVTGTNLGATSAINFGTTPGTNLVCSSGGTSCTVTAPFVASGTSANVTVVTPGGTSNPVAFTFTGGGVTPGTGVAVSYASGWNIVGGPTGTVVPAAVGPLYTYQAGNTAYQQLPPGSTLTAGQGYWAYFNSATSGNIPTAAGQTLTITLPAGNWIMVGNPGNTSATVTGADVVYTYNATAGYQQTTTLLPGQGGWAISVLGGSATVKNQ
jgi:hypothetical protein